MYGLVYSANFTGAVCGGVGGFGVGTAGGCGPGGGSGGGGGCGGGH